MVTDQQVRRLFMLIKKFISDNGLVDQFCNPSEKQYDPKS